MFISDIIYLVFLMVLLFIIIYKGFSFGNQVDQQEDQHFNTTRDALYYNRHYVTRADRQANVLTIHDETSRERRYDDIFFIEPNSVEAARIRAQLEKDDKDLPSYEEVLRMTNLTHPTAAPASSVSTLTASNASVNTTDTILPVPPYSEIDPYASTSGLTAATSAVDDATGTGATTTATSAVVVALPITTPIGTQASSNV